MLTPKQNFFNYINGKDYEWIPCSLDQQFFDPEIVPENIARGCVMQKNRYDREKYGGKDWFGVDWVFDPNAAGMGGSIEVAPLMDDINDWKDIVVFPDLSKLDWETSAKENEDWLDQDKVITSTIYTGFFERLISFIGFSDALVALVDEDTVDSVKELFDKLADFYTEVARYMNKYYGTSMIYIHDDWGSQRCPLFSNATVEEMIAPYLDKFAVNCNEMGILVELHSCGNIEKLMPELINTHVTTWRGQNINDKKMLVEKYGDKFTFKVMVTEDLKDGFDESIEKATKLYEEYKGKKVMFDYPRWIKPDKLGELAAFARSHTL